MVKTAQHVIRLKDTIPVRAKTYRCSVQKKDIINTEVQNMLEAAIEAAITGFA